MRINGRNEESDKGDGKTVSRRVESLWIVGKHSRGSKGSKGGTSVEPSRSSLVNPIRKLSNDLPVNE